MAGSLKFTSHQRGIVCCICAEEIPLEVSKANERGEAVHEECYVHSTTSTDLQKTGSARSLECPSSSRTTQTLSATTRAQTKVGSFGHL